MDLYIYDIFVGISEKNRKRCRPFSVPGSDVQKNVTFLESYYLIKSIRQSSMMEP